MSHQSRYEDPWPVPPAHHAEAQALARLPHQGDGDVAVLHRGRDQIPAGVVQHHLVKAQTKESLWIVYWKSEGWGSQKGCT